MNWGTAAEWVGAVASIFAAGAAIAALAVAIQANRTSQRVFEHDRQRTRTDIASQLQAWWVCRHGDGDELVYGVLVRNASAAATVFHRVTVHASSDGGDGAIDIAMVPPGAFFYASPAKKAGSATTWPRIPQYVPDSDLGRYEPLTATRKWTVTRITFTDPLGVAWAWTPAAGLDESTERAERAVAPRR